MDYKINKSKAISKNNMESHEEDLVISGLGFVKIVNKGVIDVYIDKDVETFMRKSLI